MTERQQMIGPLDHVSQEAERSYEYSFKIHFSEATFLHKEDDISWRHDQIEGWASMHNLSSKWDIWKDVCEKQGVRVTWRRRLILKSEPHEFEPTSHRYGDDNQWSMWIDQDAFDEAKALREQEAHS